MYYDSHLFVQKQYFVKPNLHPVRTVLDLHFNSFPNCGKKVQILSLNEYMYLILDL